MESTTFDRIARLFAERRLSRRTAIGAGGTGLAAVTSLARLNPALAQEATPAAVGTPVEIIPPEEQVEYLFVQSFQQGSIAPKEGEEGTFTLVLDHSLGQTLYFSDRPARIVGAASTSEFLEGFSFSQDDPPNAALVLQSESDQTTIAVVELLNPVLDPATSSLTYDARPLSDAEQGMDMSFAGLPTEAGQLGSNFGPAHLFIDDCPDAGWVDCYTRDTQRGVGRLTQGPFPTCWYPREARCLRCVDWDFMCTDAFRHFCVPAGGCVGVGFRIK